jgi:hypothetical protein
MRGTTVVSALSMAWGVAGAMSFSPQLAAERFAAAIARPRIRGNAFTLGLPVYSGRLIP